MKPYYLRDNEEICQCVAIGISDDGKHDERYECEVCRKCCADSPMIKESHLTYDDKGTCVECALKNGMTLEEVAGVFN